MLVSGCLEARTSLCTADGSDDGNQFVACQVHLAVTSGQGLSPTDSARRPDPRGVTRDGQSPHAQAGNSICRRSI